MTDLHNEFGNSRFYNQSRVDRRSADALVGVSAGLIADGTINQAEAQFLKGWLESNLAHLDDPVINILFKRVQEMLSDGVLDADESTELFDILRQFSGLGLVEEGKQAFVASNQLPFTKPAPPVEFDGKVFVFTGTMAYGARKVVAELAAQSGAVIAKGVSGKVDYLVVGSIGNDQWLHATYGTKIMEAVKLREAGHGIAIVGEDHFFKVLLG
ncbi:NAD-dependent DNA ligase [Pseudomonas aeruginosa]|nr:NAD-dependent DNA ligase [Pseudomonas aeruginosa]MCU9088407.1 NAD-dependent DNA ligase [Pseudomonas aeruginosa]